MGTTVPEYDNKEIREPIFENKNYLFYKKPS